MGLGSWISDRLDDAADIVQTWTGEKDRRETVRETQEETEHLREDVTNNVSVLNNLAVEFNSRVDKLNELREKAIQELVGQLRNHLSLFGHLKDASEFVPETYRRRMELIPEKELQTEENYISSYDWDEEQRFDFSFTNGIFGTKKKTEEIVYELTEHLGQLKLLRKELAKEFELKVNRRNLEISIAQTYLDVIDVLIAQIEGVIIPKLSVIKNLMIAKHVAQYEEQLKDAENSSVMYSADTLRGTNFEEYGVFVRNAFGFYVLSANVLSNAVLTHLLYDSVSEDDAAALNEQKNAVEYQVRALEGK